jgi:hypothetical protein
MRCIAAAVHINTSTTDRQICASAQDFMAAAELTRTVAVPRSGLRMTVSEIGTFPRKNGRKPGRASLGARSAHWPGESDPGISRLAGSRFDCPSAGFVRLLDRSVGAIPVQDERAIGFRRGRAAADTVKPDGRGVFGETADILSRTLAWVPKLGLAAVDQEMPFQCSTRVGPARAGAETCDQACEAATARSAGGFLVSRRLRPRQRYRDLCPSHQRTTASSHDSKTFVNT